MSFLTPSCINIETYVGCNSKCVMCPSATSKRKKGAIDPKLFIRLADQVAAMPDMCGGPANYGGPYVSLEGIGEPLLNKNIADRVAELKARRVSCVKLASNSSLLTEERAHALMEAGLDFIELAVETTDKETYEGIRVGLDGDTVIGNIVKFLSIRDERRSSLAVALAIVVHSTTMAHLKADIDFWSRHLGPADFIRLVPRHNFAGTAGPETGSEIPAGTGRCGIPFTTIDICGDGTVRLCCVDSEAEVVLGDATTDSLVDIYNNERSTHMRALHNAGRRSELPLCSSCNLPECSSTILRPRSQ